MDGQLVAKGGDILLESSQREISAKQIFFRRRSVTAGVWLPDAQIYDDCVRNQVFFFVVTNLRQWVFGSFVGV